ncbi:ankyrin repeat domain-containing protein [Geminicoccaceae bacterium 1502E]|nr:ankyrin repeat domain-containing protein [Geminicoccaceae bacterium 1502E]
MRSTLPAAALAVAMLQASPAPARSVDEMKLLAAAKDCYPREVVELLDRGVSIESRSTGGHTPLIMAASNGCSEVVRILIERGADLEARDDMGLTAREAARINQERGIMAALDAAAAGKAGPPAAAPQPQPQPQPQPRDAGQREQPPRPRVAEPRPPAPPQAMPAAAPARWPAPGSYAVGQTVRYRSGGNLWHTGVVTRVDPRYGYDIEGETGSIDPLHVAGMEREPFWTGWFLGDWRVTVPVASEVMTDGIDLYRVYHGGLPLPPLRINADGTWSWRFVEGKGERLHEGRWSPRPDAPGIYLENGPNGVRWEIYSNSYSRSELGETIIITSETDSHYNGYRM